MTNPSRPESNGREAAFGSSLRCEECPHSAETGDADVRHRRLCSSAEHDLGAAKANGISPSPIAMFDAAQAVLGGERSLRTRLIDTQAAAMLGMIWTMASGLVLVRTSLDEPSGAVLECR